jgi:hypothetical protein
MVSVALSSGLKGPERGADHSSKCRAEFKNGWSYTSTPPYVLMAQYFDFIVNLPTSNKASLGLTKHHPMKTY